MSETDAELLRRYEREHAEEAFAEIVRRYLNLVYAAALRQVRSPQLAEEVAQSAFTELARNSGRLAPDTVLAAWLYQVTRRRALDLVRREARRQLREQIATEMNAANATTDDWRQIEPLLDEAMHALDETERAAVLLRYFENKSLREVGAALGTSDDAAQKRVTRAVERLREFLAKRGVTVGAGGLVVVISANAVQAAPAGLAVTISAAAIGAAIQTPTAILASKAIAMTTVQKTIIGTTLAVAVGAGVYEARQGATLRSQVDIMQQQQSPLTEQVKRLQEERDAATARQATLEEENARLKETVAEVPKLRGELARLRSTPQQIGSANPAGLDANDPDVQNFLAMRALKQEINRYLERMPDKKIPELKLLRDEDWVMVTREAKFDSDAEVRKTLSRLRSRAKDRMFMASSLYSFTHANNGQLPTDISQLKPAFKSAVEYHGGTVDDATLDAIFTRYSLLRTGNVSELPADAWVIVEKAPVDKDYDSRAKFGVGRSTIISTGIGEAGDPDDKFY
jgi:RNA polymerase sigma factor (sigma-70 family)